MSDLDGIIRKHTLKNAFDFGKANPGAVAGKVIAELSDCKKDMKATMKSISDAVAKVNKMKKADIEKEMTGFVYAEKPKEEKKEIEVEGAEMGKAVVRYPPEPNGWPHIGHAKAFCLSHAIAKRYNGKIILRWDDTNPEAEKAEFVDAIKEGIKWLGLDWQEEKYCSDYIPEMYKLCEKLLKDGNAYACSCKQDEISKGREKTSRCAHGSQPLAKNLEMWKKMLDGSVAGGAMTIRLKGDMASQNTVMRDPTLFRIITTPHFRQKNKYRVWPTYDFQGAVMDSLLGITHPIRSKEYELRDELYAFLLDKLGMRIPKMLTISRLEIKNAPISKRLLRPLVEEGKLMGWDDPRLPTLAGLRRRGILPEAIRNFVLSFGLSKVESEPDWEALLVENRKLLDPVADRYFFVADPVELVVDDAPEETARLRRHPKLDHGFREIETSGTFYISKADADTLEKDETFRLKDLFDVEISGREGSAIQGAYAGDEKVSKKFQWVSDGRLECDVLVPQDLLRGGEYNPESLKTISGYCEKNCAKLAAGEMLQFERFGFVRLDRKAKDKLTFIFTC